MDGELRSRDLLSSLEVEEELMVMADEMANFLDVHVPRTHESILALLDEASHQLRTFKEHEVSQPPGQRVSFESEEKADKRVCVAGSFFLSECHCEGFDCSVRFAKYNKGNTLNFSTAPKSFYLLRQLQDSLHLVEEASDLAVQLACVPSPDSESDQYESAPDWMVALARIRHVGIICDEIVSLLCRIENEMADWTSRALPSMQQNWLRMEPPLPPDLLLQMYVDRSAIVLRVCVLAMHAPNRCPPNRLLAAPGDTASRLKGRVISHKGGWIEVVESVDIRCPVSALSLALRLVAQTSQAVEDLRLSAQALESSVAYDEAAFLRARLQSRRDTRAQATQDMRAHATAAADNSANAHASCSSAAPAPAPATPGAAGSVSAAAAETQASTLSLREHLLAAKAAAQLRANAERELLA